MKRSEAVYQRAIYLVSNPHFQESIRMIRKNAGLPAGGFKTEAALEKWKIAYVYDKWEEDNVETSIDKAVSKIINHRPYALSSSWHHAVKRYVYQDEIDKMELPIGIQSMVVRDSITEKTNIHVIVTEDVTRAEYEMEWERIEKWRLELRTNPMKRQRPSSLTNLELGAYAYKLHRSKLSYADIATALENKYYIADDAKTLVSNFKKKANI
jgi:hypothetical protein